MDIINKRNNLNLRKLRRLEQRENLFVTGYHKQWLERVAEKHLKFLYKGRTSKSAVIRYILDACSEMSDSEFLNFIKLHNEEITSNR